MKPTPQARQLALKRVAACEKAIGAPLFGWAVRKHLAIQAAMRAAVRIQNEADQRIARLQRSAR